MEELFQAGNVQLQAGYGRHQHVDSIFQELLSFLPEPTPQPVSDQRRTVQLKQFNVKSAGLCDRLKLTRVRNEPQVPRYVVAQGVQHTAVVSLILFSRVEIALEQVAPETGIDQIAVALVSVGRDRTEMIHREFSTDIGFRQSAIAAAPAISLPNFVVFGVGHRLTLDAQLPAKIRAKSCLQMGDALLQLSATVVKAFALGVQSHDRIACLAQRLEIRC
jgi:hypothetical protein